VFSVVALVVVRCVGGVNFGVSPSVETCPVEPSLYNQY